MQLFGFELALTTITIISSFESQSNFIDVKLEKKWNARYKFNELVCGDQ